MHTATSAGAESSTRQTLSLPDIVELYLADRSDKLTSCLNVESSLDDASKIHQGLMRAGDSPGAECA